LVKEIVLIGSSSELGGEFLKKIEVQSGYKAHTVSSKLDSKANLIVNEYLDDSEQISDYISNLNNPYVIFFNGYLKENRPKYYPNIREALETFKINFRVPLSLTIDIAKNNKNVKFVYISTIAAIKSREKNFIYGLSKALLEKNIKERNLSYLILRFGKIRTQMSEGHSNPPFTLNRSEAASLIIKFIEKEGVLYPTIGLRMMAIFIMLMPTKLLDLIEKNI